MHVVGARSVSQFARDAWKRGDAPNAEQIGFHIDAYGSTTNAES